MLTVPHFQVVFTLPAELRPVARVHPALVYDILFQAGISVLQDLARQRLGATLGITAVLHTWTTDILLHPHVHCLVTAGGLSLDGERWVPTREGYLFPQKVLGMMFRGRVMEGLVEALRAGRLTMPGDAVAQEKKLRRVLHDLSKRRARWVVHVEPPAGRPAEFVARYLARYVKRVAISDARLLECTDTSVTFRTKTGQTTIDGPEFVRRFLLHVLPKGFRKVRHAGLYAPGASHLKLERARELAPVGQELARPTDEPQSRDEGELRGEICPACGERRVIRVFRCAEPTSLQRARGPP